VKELVKSIHICQSYRKNKSGTFLWPTAYIRPFSLVTSDMGHTSLFWGFISRQIETACQVVTVQRRLWHRDTSSNAQWLLHVRRTYSVNFKQPVITNRGITI